MCCLSPPKNKIKERLEFGEVNNIYIMKHIVILILIFLALQEKTFSLAPQVTKVNVVTTMKEMGVEGDSSDRFSLQKETEAFAKNGGRKMGGETIKGRSSRRVWEKRIDGDDEEENLMAFSSDYHPPKPHPPKNN